MNSVKESLRNTIELLSDEEARQILEFIQRLRSVAPPSLMSKLKRIKIYAPPDFATNLDLYVSGEKSVQ